MRIFAGFFILYVITSMSWSASAQVTIGEKDSLYSTVLGEMRPLLIYDPSTEDPDSTNRYPVIFLLDGESNFPWLSGMVKNLGSGFVGMMPKMIIVGLPNTNRTRDLTPYPVAPGQFMDSAMAAASGGAEAFTTFIGKELMPYIHSRYRAADYHVLVGHSFGGLFALNALLYHNELFRDYVVIDPSLWYDHRKFSQKATKLIRSTDHQGRSLFLSIGNNLPWLDTVKVKQDTSLLAQHEQSILSFAASLNGASNGLRYHYRYYDKDDHSSIPLISTYDALRWFYDSYAFSYYLAGDKSLDLPKALARHYEEQSKHFGFSLKPEEGRLMNFIALAQMSGRDESILSLYDLWLRYYPNSAEAARQRADYLKRNKNVK
ncbi:MAG: hypothetical protein RL732_1181 [Bacteroidota bacterium]